MDAVEKRTSRNSQAGHKTSGRGHIASERKNNIFAYRMAGLSEQFSIFSIILMFALLPISFVIHTVVTLHTVL